ncbi:MAG: hypothetical protein ABJG42_24735 [Vibrio splendidus]
MYEPHQILGAILFGAIFIYLAVFYGSLLIAYIYGSYLHDGDKKIWSLPSQIASHRSWMNWGDGGLFSTILASGFFYPTLYCAASAFAFNMTRATGMLLPYILMGAASAWSILYVLRLVIRLNKKVDAHAKDKNAHS